MNNNLLIIGAGVYGLVAKEIAEMDINLLAEKLESIHKTIISSGVVLNITGTDFGIKSAKNAEKAGFTLVLIVFARFAGQKFKKRKAN